VSDGIFEAVRQVLSATIPSPKTALLQDTTKQIRITQTWRNEERGANDRADIEVGHLQAATVKLEQAIAELKNIPSIEVLRVDLERIRGELEAQTVPMRNRGGAPRKHSPTHMGLAVMGALKRGDVPSRNWQALTAKLLETAAGLSRSEATTGARYARAWLTKPNAE
jgi:hypothetical protein